MSLRLTVVILLPHLECMISSDRLSQKGAERLPGGTGSSAEQAPIQWSALSYLCEAKKSRLRLRLNTGLSEAGHVTGHVTVEISARAKAPQHLVCLGLVSMHMHCVWSCITLLTRCDDARLPRKEKEHLGGPAGLHAVIPQIDLTPNMQKHTWHGSCMQLWCTHWPMQRLKVLGI